MPIQNINGKYRWGENGKLYDTRKEVLKQMRAIKASQGELTKNKSDKQKRLEKKQEEENKLKKQEDLKNIVENIENLIESYKDNSNRLDIKDIINDEEFKDFEVYNMENFDKYKEIFIIGLPGSGKTTISEKISKKYNIPVYHLDDLWGKDSHIINNDMSEEEAEIALINFYKKYKHPIIFDGIHPIIFNDKEYYKNKPIIIIKTNFITSMVRALNRNFPNYFDKFKQLYKEFDNTYDVYSKLINFKKEVGLNNISLSESINHNKFYHISFKDSLEGIWKPKNPDGGEVENKYYNTELDISEPNLPRISVSTSIEKCFQTIYPNISKYFEEDNYPYMEFYVYSPILKGNEKIISSKDLVNKRMVHDAHMTDEYIILNPVYMKKIYKIKIYNTNKNTFLYHHPFNDNKMTKIGFAPDNIKYNIIKDY
jgi:hypothetical protein